MAVNPAIFGIDILLEDGDIAATNGGDLQAIDALNNLSQAIKHALTTEIGSLFYDLSYGVSTQGILGQKNIPLLRSRLRTEIRSILSNENRVEQIQELTITQNAQVPSQIDVFIRVKPIESTDTIEVNLVYPFVLFAANPNSVLAEPQVSLNASTIHTEYPIYDITGVYLADDSARTGTNYFVGGYTTLNIITLGTSLPGAFTNVIVDYNTLQAVRTNIQVTEIDSEQSRTKDGISIALDYSIYALYDAYLVTDTTQTGTDYASGSWWRDKIVTLGTKASPNDNFSVNYATTDSVTRGG